MDSQSSDSLHNFMLKIHAPEFLVSAKMIPALSSLSIPALSQTGSPASSSPDLQSFSSQKKSSRTRTGKAFKEEGFVPYFPVILIPGFGSSGLVAEHSFYRKWEGERIWLDFEKPEFKWFKRFASKVIGRDEEDEDCSEDELEDQREREKMDRLEKELDSPNAEFRKDKDRHDEEGRSMWVNHLCLGPDGVSDPPGIKVRPMKGLKGIDYLEPGPLSSHFSYVFGPVINQLQEVGYTEKNLLAAPFDWRLPPRALEERDQFFSNLIKEIEDLYERNNQFPVVLVCYSMGYKIINYFLNFTKRKIGQEWIDKHVHSLFTIAAPFLGSPESARALITGEKMGLNMFLTDSEATSIFRTWGSAPLLFQSQNQYSSQNQASIYCRSESLLEIEILEIHFPPHYEGESEVKIEVGNGYYRTERKTIVKGHISFHEKAQLVTSQPYHLSPDDVLSLSIRGREKKKKLKTWGSSALRLSELLDPLPNNELGYEGWIHFLPSHSISRDASEVLESASHSLHDLGEALHDKLFHHKGDPKKKELQEQDETSLISLRFKAFWRPGLGNSSITVDASAGEPDKQVHVKMSLEGSIKEMHIDDSLKGDLRTIERLTSEATTKGAITAARMKYTSTREPYEPKALHDVLQVVAPQSVEQHRKYYLEDDIFSSQDLEPPPVKRLFGVYGVNLETEVAQFYRRKQHRRGKNSNLYELDPEGKIPGFKCSNGLGFETPNTLQIQPDTGKEIKISGDHTVPYCSLRYCMTWAEKKDIRVEVFEIEKVTHRGILYSEVMHEYLLEYLCRNSDEVMTGSVEMKNIFAHDLPPEFSHSPRLNFHIELGTAEKTSFVWKNYLSSSSPSPSPSPSSLSPSPSPSPSSSSLSSPPLRSPELNEPVSIFNHLTFKIFNPEEKGKFLSGGFSVVGLGDGMTYEGLEASLEPSGRISFSLRIFTHGGVTKKK